MKTQPSHAPLPDKDDRFRSLLMDSAFEQKENDRNFRIGLMIALYLTLAIIWMPGWQMGDRVTNLNEASIYKPQKRKVLKPPPIEPIKTVLTKERRARKVPMPDMTPDEPEPVVEPDPPPEPEVLFTDDWEIGIPDDGAIPEPPAQESIARVGQVGVEPPVFTAKVMPQYPRLGMQVKVEGYVILEAILRKSGHIDDIKVLRPLANGKLGFENEAIKALKKWKFMPGKVNDLPADVRMTLKVDFQLARGISTGN